MSKSRSGKVGTVMPAAIASARAQGSPAARAEAHRDGRRSEAAPRPEAARNERRVGWDSGCADMCPPAGRVTCPGPSSANYGRSAARPTWGGMTTDDETEAEAQMEAAAEAIREAVLRLLEAGEIDPQYGVLAAARGTGELGAGGGPLGGPGPPMGLGGPPKPG